MKKKDQNYILKLFPAIKKIKDPELSRKVLLLWYQAWKSSNYLRVEDVHQFEPARDYISYTNVAHTNQVCRACQAIAAMVSKELNLKLHMDYLLAGAILHDVDKIMIFDSKTGGFTETGRRKSHASPPCGPHRRQRRVPGSRSGNGKGAGRIVSPHPLSFPAMCHFHPQLRQAFERFFP
ncbi:MAG: putative hydrolase [Deltaproteobacteria bacterium]|nr:putative hydrolase [Deltaproteobacteria bacterium]